MRWLSAPCWIAFSLVMLPLSIITQKLPTRSTWGLWRTHPPEKMILERLFTILAMGRHIVAGVLIRGTPQVSLLSEALVTRRLYFVPPMPLRSEEHTSEIQ